jgi:hypothetical protein
LTRPFSSLPAASRPQVPCVCPSRVSGFFVPKLGRGRDCKHSGMPDLERPSVSVRWRPLLAMAIGTHFATRWVRELVSRPVPGRVRVLTRGGLPVDLPAAVHSQRPPPGW